MPRFRRILVPLDSALPDPGLLAFVERLARTQGAEVTLCDVVREFTWAQRLVLPDADRVCQLVMDAKTSHLEALAEKWRGQIPVGTRVLHGSASDVIANLAADGGYDLIAMLAKGPQSRRKRFFGTTAYRLLQTSPCSILLYEPGKVGSFQRLVASVDATPDDRRHASLNDVIVNAALAIAETEKCPWDVVFAWCVYGEYLIKDYLKHKEFDSLFKSTEVQYAESFANLLRRYGLTTESPNVHLLHGEPAEQIHQVVSQVKADLVVLGTVSRRGVSRLWLGNTAESLLDRVQSSVLIVKPDAK